MLARNAIDAITGRHVWLLKIAAPLNRPGSTRNGDAFVSEMIRTFHGFYIIVACIAYSRLTEISPVTRGAYLPFVTEMSLRGYTEVTGVRASEHDIPQRGTYDVL